LHLTVFRTKIIFNLKKFFQKEKIGNKFWKISKSGFVSFFQKNFFKTMRQMAFWEKPGSIFL